MLLLGASLGLNRSGLKVLELPGLPYSAAPVRKLREVWRFDGTTFWQDVVAFNRWAYPQAAGGMAYVSDNDEFHLSATGELLGPSRRDNRELSSDFCDAFIPAGDGGFYLSRELNVAKLDSAGRQEWLAILGPSDPNRLGRQQQVVLALAKDGTLHAFGEQQMWRLDAHGQITGQAPHAGGLAWVEELLLLEDGTLVAAGRTAEIPQTNYAVGLKPDGTQRWRLRVGSGRNMTLHALDGGDFLLAGDRYGLARLSPAGDVQWRRKVGLADFDGASYAVTRDSLLVWEGTKLHRLDTAGKRRADPIELGMRPWGYWEELRELHPLPGGGVCIQLDAGRRATATDRSGTVLALDASGAPLWQLALPGGSGLELVAAGPDAKLYFYREGAVIESTKWTRTSHCSILCCAVE